jgi:hypothetical protein
MELVQVVPGGSRQSKNRWISTVPKNSRLKFGRERPYRPPTFVEVPLELSAVEIDQFFREQRVDDLTRKLRAHALELGDPKIRDRSPPPTYDRDGNRVNSREDRVRTSMETEYARLTRFLVKRIPDYLPPSDLNKPVKFFKKIEIPSSDFINFVSVIVGPRGLNHKRLQDLSGCRIEIRGSNSSSTSQTYEESILPQHVHVEGDSDESVEKGVELITPLLDPSSPEFQAAKLGAAEQMAVITHGESGQRCSVCQATGHSATTCPEIRNTPKDYTTIQIKCGKCGGKGHLTIDCRSDESEATKTPSASSSSKISPVMIPSELIGQFIGQGGANIKRLMYESGCNVQVDQSNIASNPPECPLMIHGPPTAIAKAQQMCVEWIDTAKKSKDEKFNLLQQQHASGAFGKFSDPETAAAAVQMAYMQQMYYQAWIAQQYQQQ